MPLGGQQRPGGQRAASELDLVHLRHINSFLVSSKDLLGKRYSICWTGTVAQNARQMSRYFAMHVTARCCISPRTRESLKGGLFAICCAVTACTATHTLPQHNLQVRDRSNAQASHLAEQLLLDAVPAVTAEELHTLLEEFGDLPATGDEQQPRQRHPPVQQQDAAVEQPPLAAKFTAPPPVTLLQPGMSFHGQQRVATYAMSPRSRVLMGLSGLSHIVGRKHEETWAVGVTLLGYDHAQGYVCGHMQAREAAVQRCMRCGWACAASRPWCLAAGAGSAGS